MKTGETKRRRKGELNVKKSRFYNENMASGIRQAHEARKEFMDTFAISDAWLMFIIAAFSVLGNTYKVKRQSEVWVGVAMFAACFLVYLALKAWEAKNNEPKVIDSAVVPQEEEEEPGEDEPLKPAQDQSMD